VSTLALHATINGQRVEKRIEHQELLLDFLRDRLALTGAKRSCDLQVCGTCTVLLDNQPISSCCTLAADIEGHEILTIEGLAALPEFARFEEVFIRHAALQCGFCTPGILLTAKALVDSGELSPESAEIKHALAGNLCRCTGYRAIVEAVQDLASTSSGVGNKLAAGELR
jgi:aerobic carbon-monoxide dehydrogenase small subunit